MVSTVRLLAPFPRFSETARADIESFGYAALLKAARDYKPDRGASFSTFVIFVLRKALWPKVYERRAELDAAPLSLDAPLPGKEEGTLGDHVPSCPLQNPASIALSQAERDLIWQNVAAKLDKKSALVLHLYYAEEKPLTAIAAEFGQQPHQIAALRDKALKILREAGTKKTKVVVVKAKRPRKGTEIPA